MNAIKKKEAMLEKEIRKLKRDIQRLGKENGYLKETNKWLNYLVETYKKDVLKKDPNKQIEETKPYVKSKP